MMGKQMTLKGRNIQTGETAIIDIQRGYAAMLERNRHESGADDSDIDDTAKDDTEQEKI